MIAVGNENGKIKNKDIWNYCHRMSMLPLLGANHRLLSLHMAKRFICLEEKGEGINEFAIEYMISTSFHVSIAFK